MSEDEDPFGDADPWAHLRSKTSARIALGRSGNSLPTKHVLAFALAHAKARDAVHAKLDVAALRAELGDFAPIVVRSLAESRSQYLQRPDLGRRLTPDSRGALHPGPYDVAVVMADGLSATAVQTQGAALFKQLTASPHWRFAPPVIALEARVALGDEIATALQATLVVVLIGERPGLSAPDSLGAYITYAPSPGLTTDAERNCVSNIRQDGLGPDAAAAILLSLIELAQRLHTTGTRLKQDEALALQHQTQKDHPFLGKSDAF
jgi:ethanolamine ammonia-lyase small subunit